MAVDIDRIITHVLIDPSESFYAVFGWYQDSFVGIEQESPYNLSVGYLKGAEQAGASARLMLNVLTKFMNARKQPYCYTRIVNSSTYIQVPRSLMGIEPTYSYLWTRCDALPYPRRQGGGEEGYTSGIRRYFGVGGLRIGNSVPMVGYAHQNLGGSGACSPRKFWISHLLE